jgi:hypothetical protein
VIRKRLWTLGLLFSFCGLLTSEASAQLDDATNKESLRGLNGITVVVLDPSPEVERDVIAKTKLRTDAELKLRQAGIRVVAYEDYVKGEGGTMGLLQLYVGALKWEKAFYACEVQLKLMQPVTLLRDPFNKTFATTWSTGSLGIFGVAKLEGIRKEVADKLDEFVNSYLAANPK